MGTAAVSTVAAVNPGQLSSLEPASEAFDWLYWAMSVAFFVFLTIRDLAVRRLAPSIWAGLKDPAIGPGYATIPGAINVLALATLRLTGIMDHSWGPWLVLGLAVVGTAMGLALTVVFFVNAFESDNVHAEGISGTWFIPETVILLGAILFGTIGTSLPTSWHRTMGVLSFACLGMGLLLFALTASLFFNRLVLHRQADNVGAPAMWIMISPLSVGALALPTVAANTSELSGTWGSAVIQSADFLASLLWGFSLWWVAAATLVTIHVGRRALTFTPADWGFVFPSAALVLSTLALGRLWQSGFVEGLAIAFSFFLVLLWVSVLFSAIASLARERRAAGA